MGRRRAAAGIYEDPRLRRQWRRWRRRKGGEEEEGRLQHRGGIGGIGGGGVPAADHGLRAMCEPARGAYDLFVGRGEAPVLRGTRRSGSGGLPSQEGGHLHAGQAGGGICHQSGAKNLLNKNI